MDVVCNYLRVRTQDDGRYVHLFEISYVVREKVCINLICSPPLRSPENHSMYISTSVISLMHCKQNAKYRLN